MCGIVGYLGPKQAYPILIDGLKRLEYRGYDSSGIATLESNGELRIEKKQGKVANLESHVGGNLPQGTVGIGHTRWATHGPPSDVNAHPHAGGKGRIAIIHNGIIENYEAIRELLTHRGHDLVSETDTEVLAHFIEEIQTSTGLDLPNAVRTALKEVIGAYALVVLDQTQPDRLIAARKSSPLVIGIGEDNEFFVGSDATPIVAHTKNVVYLEDEEVATMTRSGELKIRTISDSVVTPEIQAIELEIASLEKAGYDHFMLKEIFEQPKSIRDSIRGRVRLQSGEVHMSGIDDHWDVWSKAQRILILGCGTSWHAGLVAEYLFESLARIPVEVEYASEFRYRNPIVRDSDVVIAISQSGETADTLAAIRLAKEQGAHVFGVCNVVGSSIARETHSGAYTHAGPEIGVASTKAFTAQVAVLTVMAMHLGKRLGSLDDAKFMRLMTGLDNIPGLVQKVLDNSAPVEHIASKFARADNALYLGRGFQFPVALEGALKLKEISYIHAEGYPAAEMKHGPIALIDEAMPVVFIATQDEVYEKVVSNIQEVKARGGQILAIVTEGDQKVRSLADHIIEIPKVHDALSPLLTVVPMQLLSYHIALMRGCNVDQPRNLAKSVTVE
ncbi:MAG: glutamine--fructose-6-phosphate transaminase (isomerizing) [Flavobacteriales bacterium]|jgi:glucosamine--fructose-6-phosphate aminotransferase (isomerizing)|nr:glutamine--fructose-6-phosphate transaminase (isomerizing) [Flavobacteriales bacterium]